MTALTSVRVDKWLWAVRLYKTRGLAAEACRAGHVEIGGVKLKPAREVRVGEIILSRSGEITRTTRVAGLIEARVGAAVAKEFAEDLTPASEYEKRRVTDSARLASRAKGSGRPTKKERRVMSQFLQDE